MELKLLRDASVKFLHEPNVPFWTVGLDVRFGKNVRMGDYVVLEEGGNEKKGNVEIRDGCLIGNFTIIRPSAVIGENTVFSHYSVIEGNAKIGKDCRFGPGAQIPYNFVCEDLVFVGGNFHFANDARMTYKRPWMNIVLEGVTIKRAARIGVRVTVMPGVTIGENSFVCGNALITKDVPDKAIVKGYPAKMVGEVPEDEWL